MDLQLTLAVHSNGHGVILTVGGEVGLATAAQLHAKLIDLVEAEKVLAIHGSLVEAVAAQDAD
jgi:hypothetical protein